MPLYTWDTGRRRAPRGRDRLGPGRLGRAAAAKGDRPPRQGTPARGRPSGRRPDPGRYRQAVPQGRPARVAGAPARPAALKAHLAVSLPRYPRLRGDHPGRPDLLPPRGGARDLPARSPERSRTQNDNNPRRRARPLPPPSPTSTGQDPEDERQIPPRHPPHRRPLRPDPSP